MKEYKFSITKNYVSDWGLIEGIREILQNAIDSSGEMSIELEENTLKIANDGIKLPVKSLLMGFGTKKQDENSIGGKSEGSLLAIMVLLRSNYKINIINYDEVWTPSFKYDEDLDEEILTIKVVPLEERFPNQLIYEIGEFDDYHLDRLKEEFPILNKAFTGEEYTSINTQCGEIILDEEYSGKMFVEGLPIQDDNNFKFGYNFKTQYVSLDRDRKAINYYELRSLTAQSLVTAKECHPELFKAIADSCTDAKDIIDVLDDAKDEFLDSYRTMFYENKNLKENTLVATKSVKKQLEQLNSGINVVEGTEIESYLIAKANDKLDLIHEAEDKYENITQLEKDLDSFINSNGLILMEFYVKIKKYLPKKWQNVMLEIINTFWTRGERKILKYIPEGFDYSNESATKLKITILSNEDDE